MTKKVKKTRAKACVEKSEGSLETGSKEMSKELAKALDSEKKRSEDYLNRLKYLQADFENLKKRLDRQLEEVRKYCNQRLIIELLVVVDELEAAVYAGRQAKSTDTLLQGVEMTLKKLKKVLESEEAHHIECIGKLFDASKHEVIAKIEDNEVEEGRVVEEIRKGYILKGKVIRPSVVKITVKSSSKTLQKVESDEQ